MHDVIQIGQPGSVLKNNALYDHLLKLGLKIYQ